MKWRVQRRSLSFFAAAELLLCFFLGTPCLNTMDWPICIQLYFPVEIVKSQFLHSEKHKNALFSTCGAIYYLHGE
jgi:hypothetical protein